MTGYVKYDGYGLKDNAALLCCYYDYVDFDGSGLKSYTNAVAAGNSCYDTTAVYFDGYGLVRKTTVGLKTACGYV